MDEIVENIKVLNELELDVYFLNLEDIQTNDVHLLSRDYVNETGIFCKLASKRNPKEFLDINKVSFVVYFESNMLTEGVEYHIEHGVDENNNKFIYFISYNNCLNWDINTIKCFIGYKETLFSNVVDTYQGARCIQASTVVYDVPVDKPSIKTNSNVIYIEDSVYSMNSSDKVQYSYISKVLTNTGYNLFGVKRKEFFNEFDHEDEVPNINADIVRLEPNTTQVQIYSFKNGLQYAELSDSAMAMGLANEGKLIPYYLQSYEYKIDGKIPQDQNNDFNIKFYGSTGYVSTGNVSAHLDTIGNIFTKLHSTITKEEETELLKSFLAYSFVVPYTYTFDSSSQSYSKIINQAEITKRNTNSTIFENTYSDITEYYPNVSEETLRSYLGGIEIFQKTTTYLPVAKSSLIQPDIDNYPGQIYKYDQASFSYVQVNALEDEEANDMFVKCISYTKISSNINLLTNNPEYPSNSLKYVQNYEYSLVDNRNDAKNSLFYIKTPIVGNNYAYYPIQSGIVNDGSIEYYGYTYIKLPKDKIEEYKGATSGVPTIYVKQSYSMLYIDDLTNLTSSDMEKLYSYETSIIKKELLANDSTIFEFDINDNTIYGTKETIDGNEEIVPINREDLENIYFNGNDWYTANEQQEISTNNIINYGLPSNFNISAKIDYNGEWTKVDKNIESIQLSNLCQSGKLFIQKEGYNIVDTNDLVSGYDVDFYVWGIGKISPTDITDVTDIYVDSTQYVNDTTNFIHPFYIVDNYQVIYDYDTWLGTIDNYGFINDLEYYTRKPVKSISNDLFLYNSKEYYVAFSNSEEYSRSISGFTPLFPISYLWITDQSSKYSLMNYWTYINGIDDGPLYSTYIKLRNETAKILIESECDELSYTCNDIVKYPVTDFEAPISNTSSYYLKVNSYSGNKYNDITTLLQTSYEFSFNVDKFNDVSYSFDWNNIRYYKDSISHYQLSEECNFVTDVSDYDKKYLYSKFFYPEFTNNDGVHQAKDGSYYTNITIFDGTKGAVTKPLFLQPNIFNVTEYTYNYVADAYIEIEHDEDLSNVPQSEYSYYYYKDISNNKYIALDIDGHSPSYYQAYLNSLVPSQSLYVYSTKQMTAKYDGRSVGPLDNMQVQYFDNVTYNPKVIKQNDNLYGIIFNVDLTDENQSIIDVETHLFKSPIGQYDISYDYSVVPIREYIDTVYSDVDVIELQKQETKHNNVEVPTPFLLGNEKKIVFDGTYTWNLPKHTYIFAEQNDGNYVAYDVIKEQGHWERNYDITSVPLVVASYNFYNDPSQISNTTLSYTFTPDSKIVTEVIEHPEIAYKSIFKETRETTRYRYLYQGIEHEYPQDAKVQENEDGTCYGVIDIDGKQVITELIKYIDIDFVNSIKDVVHQEYDVSYKYSSYKTSIALTNERVPILYNTELIPATSHKILYWNEDAESYAVKTVVDSYAHYAYNYYYDVVPFVTTSYMRQDSDITISYIYDISYTLDNLANSLSYSIEKMSQNVSKVPQAIKELKNALLGNTVLSNELNQTKGENYEMASSPKKGGVNQSVSSFEMSSIDMQLVSNTTNLINSQIESNESEQLKTSFAQTNASLDNLTENEQNNGALLNETYMSSIQAPLTINPATININGLFNTNTNENNDNTSGDTNTVGNNSTNVIINLDNVIQSIDNQSYILSSYINNIEPKLFDINNTISISNAYLKDGIVSELSNLLSYKTESISYILKVGLEKHTMPTYEEFMVSLTEKMYAKIDFDEDIVDTEQKDENGNILNKSKHKHNPVDLAKKTIYRADILWQELKRKNIVN